MRTQSVETQLRHAKREVKERGELIAKLADEIRKRRLCGEMMSNICFNLAQNETYDAQHRQSMRDCRLMWDAIGKAKI